MSSENPYSTPEASVEVAAEEYYQPKFFSASGRIGRLRYLAYLTGAYLLFYALMVPFISGVAIVGIEQKEMMSGILAGLLGLATLVFIAFAIIVVKRRLNDLNKSGWLTLLFLVPVANFILGIYLIFFSGSGGANRYGPAPSANPTGIKVLGLLLPIIAFVGIIAAVAIPAYQDYVGKAQQAQMQSQ